MRAKILKRILQTVSIDPSTVDLLDTLSGTTGLARGRVIEAALARIETCEHCDGTGHVEPTKRRVQDGACGPDGTCGACYGARLVTRS
jgi:DnaJ-class molecular chaperone